MGCFISPQASYVINRHKNKNGWENSCRELVEHGDTEIAKLSTYHRRPYMLVFAALLNASVSTDL